MKFSKHGLQTVFLYAPIECKDDEGNTLLSFDEPVETQWYVRPSPSLLTFEQFGGKNVSLKECYMARGECLSEKYLNHGVSFEEDSGKPTHRILGVVPYPSYTKVVCEKR
ncbi:MAG: hypothetical protein LBV67_11210 [Streptococcaceae bacterium]|jgi:hypothetical protein|nr:hypothetical protein [Streptococcaceae bacterium]